jgi:hypothetical protein
LPEPRLAAIVDRVRVRMQARSLLFGLAAGGAAATGVNVAGLMAAAPGPARMLVSGLVGVAVAAWLVRARVAVTPVAAAQRIEAEAALDNLIVTAVELRERPRPVSDELRDEIVRQADARLSLVDVTRVVPLRQPVAVALAVAAGALATLTIGPEAALVARQELTPGLRASAPGIETFTVAIVPPPYSGRPAETVAGPVQVTVVAGSLIRLNVVSAAEGVFAESVGQPPLALGRGSDGFTGEWVAERSTAVAIRPVGGAGRDSKFLSVIVVPDAPPVVRVPTPGKDLAISGAKGRIAIEVDGQDDLGLASLSVRFTKASGGGESLTFTEGEVPLVISRSDDRHWRGRAEWVLDGLGLADGDVLVYRAIARDRNPNGSPVQSEQYLIEVGRLSGAVGSGFAVPAEEKKYAISQQMVIYKTEQLIASVKGKGPPSSLGEGWLEQNQLLAIEQRMVRAEVVFLGGGEVQDEVEEAAHSHEVAEGRLENTGRAEMLRAINFMSRAETELNAGRAPEALVLEREALKSLERAFDRRRYFLRTVPDRSRIDSSRRLTGNLNEARSWTRDRSTPEAPSRLAQQRALMRDLAAAANGGAEADAALAARIAALDPAESSLQQAAVALASASGDQGRRDAVWAAMQVVTTHALKSLATAGDLRLTLDPLAGRFADEVARGGKQGGR